MGYFGLVRTNSHHETSLWVDQKDLWRMDGLAVLMLLSGADVWQVSEAMVRFSNHSTTTVLIRTNVALKKIWPIELQFDRLDPTHLECALLVASLTPRARDGLSVFLDAPVSITAQPRSPTPVAT